METEVEDAGTHVGLVIAVAAVVGAGVTILRYRFNKRMEREAAAARQKRLDDIEASCNKYFDDVEIAKAVCAG